MKLVLSAAAALTALGLAAGSASAQYPSIVPHRSHYHVIPSYSPPLYSGYDYPAYSPGVTFGGVYSSPRISVGGFYPSPGYGYGSGWYTPTPVFGGYGYNWSGYHHHHGHHHHR